LNKPKKTKTKLIEGEGTGKKIYHIRKTKKTMINNITTDTIF